MGAGPRDSHRHLLEINSTPIRHGSLAPNRYDRELTESRGATTTPSNLRHRILLVLTYVVSFGSLYWALREAKLAELKDDIATMDWTWVALAAVADLGVFFWHAWRWTLVLRPLTKVAFWDSLRAVYVGLFANEVLPFRVGEVIRCYLLGKWIRQPFSVVLSSALIERIFDGIWLSVGLFAVLKIIPWPPELNWLVDGAFALFFLVFLGALLLAVAMFQKRRLAIKNNERAWRRHLRILMDDLNLIGHSRYLYFAAFASLPYLLIQVLPIYFVIRAYGFDLSVGAAMVLMILLRLGAVPPQAPGNIGIYQLIATLTLRHVFQVVPDEAARFSLVLWGVVTLPLLAGGFVALLVTGSRLDQLRAGAASASTGSPGDHPKAIS